MRTDFVTPAHPSSFILHPSAFRRSRPVNGRPVIPVIGKDELREGKWLRGHKVLLDSTLAVLYGVQTRVLMQAVQRNRSRFLPDFMFPLSNQEVANLRSQIVISSWGGRRYSPFAFTEQGVTMPSSVLNSPQAIRVNIEIMRAFVRLPEMISTPKALAAKLDELERKVATHDHAIAGLFTAIRELATPIPPKPKRRIGFVVDD